MNKKDFQSLSAERIVNLFSDGQHRVLLADEVGLGKTIVARTVVEMMHQKAKEQGRPFKVIYVCSNQSIIQQNAQKLGIDKDNVVPLSESRLSMQHKNLFMQMDNDYLIPITPSTSLKQTEGFGNANERALIYLLIKEGFDEKYHESLKWYFDVYARGKEHTYQFKGEDNEDFFHLSHNGLQYYSFIQSKLSNKTNYKEAIEGIKQELTKQEQDRKYINVLRSLFCEISMDMIKPNLVIMDEFQRYRDLMKGSEDTEENRLAQKLFNAESAPFILLVSATPYKPMATLEEISFDEKNIQFEDFNNLMEFLMGDNYTKFKHIWKEYSKLLGALSADKVDSLLSAKEQVECMLRSVMVRTERYIPNLADHIEKDIIKVMPNADEVNTYFRFRELIDSAATISGNSKKPPLNIDYLKSAPYLLSFMQHYVEKKYIEDIYKGKKGPKGERFEGLLIKEDSLKNGKKINCRNARLLALQDLAFGKDGHGLADLLWIPPSLPYYRTNSVFDKCADASKVLVFSKWGFVPRMIAAMLSHEASRQCHFKNRNNSSNALDKYKELLLSPFPKIAGWYQRGNSQIDLKDLKLTIKKRIIEGLNPHKQLLTSTTGRGYNNLLKLAQLLNGDIAADLQMKLYYDERTLDELINLIIASPGICLWRCFGADYGDTYEKCSNSGLFQFANAFVNMLGYDESQAIISKITHTGTRYSRTLKYCVNGNLQAMIDEYAFVIGYDPYMSEKQKKELWTSMQSAIINRTPIEIDTDKSFCMSDGRKFPVQRWFACDYTNISNNDNEEKRKQSIQAAFNSPFRPFVLASTSVGQEGLDFHLYCRKIVHWNLPGNPINLEQRSGRINRYEGLAIRRTVAHMFKGVYDWEKLFEKADNDWHSQYKGYNKMVPYWCIPKECIINKSDTRIERIENIFLLYAMSHDIEEHSNLMKQLDLYRLTMGQPDQEFLINLLDQLNMPEEMKEKLTFHLSPSQK